MTVTNIEKDLDTLTLTVNAEFAAPGERTWRLWADPRQLERWWGPPTYPATFVHHDLTPGSLVTYFMTSPEGERYHGWWRVVAVDAPRTLEVEDGFGKADGTVDETMPVTNMLVTLTTSDEGGTRVQITSRYASRAAMDQLVAMGMEEGLTAAMGQMDTIVAE